MIPAPSSGVKMHQQSITEVWKKTFDTREVTVNTSRQPIVMGTIKNKTGSKFGQGGVMPTCDIRKMMINLKKIREEDKETEKTPRPQPPIHHPPPSQPIPTMPDIPSTPTSPKPITTPTTPYLTPPPPPVITSKVEDKKKEGTPGSKKKRRLVDKKTAKKTRLEDIRRFWKKKDEEDMIGQEDKTRKIPLSESKTISILKTSSDIKKTESDVKCEFDDKRMCVVHDCVAEEIIVRISRYRKDCGFYKESVKKLKCSGHRVGGSTVSEIDSKHVPTDPAAPVLEDLRLLDEVAHQKTGKSLQEGGKLCDWRRTDKETDPRVVIGRQESSNHTLPGEVKKLDRS